MRKFKAPPELRRMRGLIRDISNSYHLPAKLNFYVVSDESDVPPECEISGYDIPREQWGKVMHWCIVLTEG